MTHPEDGEWANKKPEKPSGYLEKVIPGEIFGWLKQDIAWHQYSLSPEAFRKYLDERVKDMEGYVDRSLDPSDRHVTVETFDAFETKAVEQTPFMTTISSGEVEFESDAPYMGRTFTGTLAGFHRDTLNSALYAYIDTGEEPIRERGVVVRRYTSVSVLDSEITFTEQQDIRRRYSELGESVVATLEQLPSAELALNLFANLTSSIANPSQSLAVRIHACAPIMPSLAKLLENSSNPTVMNSVYDIMRIKLNLLEPRTVMAAKYRQFTRLGYFKGPQRTFDDVMIDFGLFGETDKKMFGIIFNDKDQNSVGVIVSDIRSIS